MDVFSRTFLPAAAEAGVPIPTVSRHMPVFRRCVDPDDATVLVTRCHRAERSFLGDFLLLLTYRRLVVTQETRVLHRLRLHLNADLRHLNNVTWNPDPRLSAVELAATAVDGVRERFWMRVADPHQVWHLDALLAHAFRPRARAAAAVPAHLPAHSDDLAVPREQSGAAEPEKVKIDAPAARPERRSAPRLVPRTATA